MNSNLFHRIFSKRLGMLVAVPETAVGHGANGGRRAGSSSGATTMRGVVSSLTSIALALVTFGAANLQAQTLPTNGQVVAGQAAISQPNGNTMTIDQASQRAVIDWQTFNIGKGNTVQFQQPNAQAQALNRVTGGVPSAIHGALLANGQVLIQNANGVLFGKNAVVNVGSLLATTKAIDANAFMAGDPLVLSATGTQAGVVNEGNIQAAGFVTLMGDTVRNSGTIGTAPGGQVVLAAGDSATVALANGQGIKLVLNDATAGALVENTGNIHAQDGTVLLTARGKDTLLDTVVNLDGFVRAGTVVADAGTTGDVVVTGVIDASNTAPGASGGTVVLSGDRVGLFGDVSVDVSGDAAGGTVVIGGDTLHRLTGTQAEALLQDGVNFASLTQVDAGARVRADAVHGNGGFVETSGLGLDVQGTVSAKSEHGQAGAWLIDPTNITISTGNDSGYTGDVTDGFSGGSNNAATVRNTSISDALNTGTDVTITTASSGKGTGNIVQEAGADIIKSSGGEANLTLLADGSIDLKGNIASTSDKLNLNMSAGAQTGRGTVRQDAGSTIDLNGGSLNVSGNTSKGAGLTNHAIELSGKSLNIGGGSLTGAAGAGEGVRMRGTMDLVGDGTFNVNGTAVRGTGVRMNGATINVGDQAKLVVDGTSSSGSGVFFDGDGKLNIRDEGSADITGTSQTGRGVQMTGWGSLMSVADSGSLSIKGTSVNQIGLEQRQGSIQASGNATVNLSGTSKNQAGILQTAGFRDHLSDDAHLSMNGESEANAGIYGYIVIASGNSSADINGKSVRGGGTRGVVNTTDNARVSVTGSSQEALGVLVGGTIGGSSSLEVNGSSVNDYGVGAAGTKLHVTDNATANVMGTSENGNGVQWSNNFEVSKAGKLNVTGNSTTGSGIRLTGGTLDIGDGGAVNLQGTSVKGAGVLLDGAFTANVGVNGSLTINGESEEGAGILQKGKLDITGSGDIDIAGKSTSGTGVDLTDDVSIKVSDTGSLNLSGKSTTDTGVSQGGTMDIGGGGKVTIDGTSSDGDGVKLTGTGTIGVTDTGTLDISGTSDSGSGVSHTGQIDVTGTGRVNVDGKSGSGTGVDLSDGGVIDVSGGGGINVDGTSVDGTGVSQGGAISVKDGGQGAINGSSTNGTGLKQADTGTVDVGGTGQLGLTGDSVNGTGAEQGGKIRVTDGGGVAVDGKSGTGTGIAQTGTGTIDVSGTGSATIDGTSTSGTGVDQGGAIRVTDGGGVAVDGKSGTGTGIAQTGTGTIDVGGTGSATIDGTSTSGTGVDQNGAIRFTDGGSGSIHGTSVDGTGVAQGPDGVIDVGPGASVTIAGKSLHGSSLSDGMRITGEGNVQLVDKSPSGQFGGRGALAAWATGEAGSLDSDEAVTLEPDTSVVVALETAEPEALVMEAGDPADWHGAVLDVASLDTLTDVATVKLQTPAASLVRGLQYSGTEDGVAHYAYVDPVTETTSELSVDVKTHAFEYTESGVRDGKSYLVGTHGQLHAYRMPARAGATEAVAPEAEAGAD